MGILAKQRDEIAALLEDGASRTLFSTVSAPLPRVAELADLAAGIAVGEPPSGALARLLLGTLAFGLAALGLAAWRFEGKDF